MRQQSLQNKIALRGTLFYELTCERRGLYKLMDNAGRCLMRMRQIQTLHEGSALLLNTSVTSLLPLTIEVCRYRRHNPPLNLRIITDAQESQRPRMLCAVSSFRLLFWSAHFAAQH